MQETTGLSQPGPSAELDEDVWEKTSEWSHGRSSRDAWSLADLKNYRFYIPFRWASLCAIAIHATVTTLFVLLHAWALVWFNMFSIPLYVACFFLNEKGYQTLAMALGLGEILVHQVLCVHFLGWDVGFQYYIMAVSIIVFFQPTRLRWLKNLSFGLCVLVFVGLYVLYHDATPFYQVADWAVFTLGIINYLAPFLVLGIIGAYYSLAVDNVEHALQAEHIRSESLLHNILPAPIAVKLKRDGQTMAEGFDEATILFADIVDFTPLSQQIPPAQLANMLNDVFCLFDDLVEKYHLEKIKTIGDAYMAAGGVPKGRVDHVTAMAELALDMQHAVRGRTLPNGQPLRMRIGIHTGPVVAGVIGKKRFIYDLWGDTVNTAARMESHGLPGEIHISQAVQQILASYYILEERGLIEVKGKGKIPTWFLKGRRHGHQHAMVALQAVTKPAY